MSCQVISESHAVERGSIDVNFACWWAISLTPFLSSYPRAYEYTFQIYLGRIAIRPAGPFEQRKHRRVSAFLQAEGLLCGSSGSTCGRMGQRSEERRVGIEGRSVWGWSVGGETW